MGKCYHLLALRCRRRQWLPEPGEEKPLNGTHGHSFRDAAIAKLWPEVEEPCE